MVAPNNENFDKTLQRGRFLLETDVQEIAAISQPSSTATIEIAQHYSATAVVPQKILDYFERNGSSVTAITSIDLVTAYSGKNQLFRPQQTAVNFDNGASMEFHSTPGLERMGVYHLYIRDLAKPNQPTKSQVVSNDQFNQTMQKMGLELPVSGARDISEITRMLQFSESWRAIFARSVLLSPGSALHIEDMYTKDYPLPEDRTIRGLSLNGLTRVLRISEDVFEGNQLDPTLATQLIFYSRDFSKVPRLKRAADIALTYAEDGDPFLLSAFLEHPVRHRVENRAEAQRIKIDLQILNRFFGLIKAGIASLKEEAQ